MLTPEVLPANDRPTHARAADEPRRRMERGSDSDTALVQKGGEADSKGEDEYQWST